MTSNTLNCQFYCLSFNNPEKKQNILHIFQQLDIPISISHGVSHDDPRLQYPGIYKRAWSNVFGHLDIIRDFYNNSSTDYAIICEDDIMIRKDFKNYIHSIISHFQDMKLDVLLLGYLSNHTIDYLPIKNTLHNYESSQFPFQYFDFSQLKDNFWGTQMFMISKSYAQYLLNNYDLNYAIHSITNNELIPFAADHFITKLGNSALIYPLIAIEDGKSTYDHYGQQHFHDSCFHFHFDRQPDLFI
jgi:hypothetical protein